MRPKIINEINEKARRPAMHAAQIGLACGRLALLMQQDYFQSIGSGLPLIS
jgi:hypothetical protein